MSDAARSERESTTPCTVISADFALLGKLQRAQTLQISRVLAHLQRPLRPETEEELLVVDVRVANREEIAEFLTGARGFPARFLLVREGDDVGRWRDLDAVAVSVSDWLRDAPGESSGSAPGAAAAPSGLPVVRSQTAVVFSPKGGVGRTTVAVNLACRARQTLGVDVVLLDLDIGGGDAAVHLNLTEEPTIIDLAAYGDDLHPEQVRDFAAVHRDCGLHLLGAPGRPELVELVPWEDLAPVIRTCQRAYDLVVIDTPGDPASEVSYRALETASYILAPVLPDVCAPRRLTVALRIMRELELGLQDELRMVLNRSYDGAPVGEADLTRYVQRPLVARFPEAAASAVEAIDAGRPLVLGAGDEGMRRAADAVLEDMFGVTVGGETESWLGRWVQKLTGRFGRG